MAEKVQQAFFGPPEGTLNCVRCSKRCRVAAKRNPNAELFVKGTKETGRYCADCLVVDFLKNSEDDPAGFRLPHMQQQMVAIILAARKEHGAELTPEEVDWDEVIANWHLPFPEKPKRRRAR